MDLGNGVAAAAWLAAAILGTYGAVLSIGGLLVRSGGIGGGIGADADPDLSVIRWQALSRDPWLLAWGLVLLAALVASQRLEGVRS